MIFIRLVNFDLKNNIIKKPVMIVYMFIMPILLFYILQGIASNEFGINITSADYYGVTVLIFFQLGMGTMVSNALIENSVRKPNIRIIYSLENKSYIYNSKIVSTLLCNLVSVMCYMIFCTTIFNVNFGKNILLVYLAYIILGLFSMSLGTLLCTILKEENLTNNILGITQSVLCLLGGVFFPIESMGNVVKILSDLSIVKWILDGIYKNIYDGVFTNILIICSISIVISLIIMSFVKYTFRVEDYI